MVSQVPLQKPLKAPFNVEAPTSAIHSAGDNVRSRERSAVSGYLASDQLGRDGATRPAAGEQVKAQAQAATSPASFLGYLNQRQLLTTEHLQALQQLSNAEQKDVKALRAALLASGIVSDLCFWQNLALWMGVEYVDLREHRPDGQLLQRIPAALAQRYQAVLLESQTGKGIKVGFADPRDIVAVDTIERALHRTVQPCLINPDLLSRLAPASVELESLAHAANAELGRGVVSYQIDELQNIGDAGGAALGRMLASMFVDAVKLRASDVHIQPEEGGIRLRFRIDGCLQEQWLGEPRLAAALVSRLKLLAGLDIAEKRLPQDGRFAVDVENRSVDVRMSTLPIGEQETVCLRLIDQQGQQLGLQQLGLSQQQQQQFNRLLERPNGLVLIAGPTGSGKTTTIYAALQQLNAVERKIITVEDPIEYRLPRLAQIQVQASIGLDFARVLRSALRHDPDVLAIGEMRDPETAGIALRASLTGHMVLSTIHSSSAGHAVARLKDLGVESYAINAGLTGIVSQRLLRALCRRCAIPVDTRSDAARWLQARQAAGELSETLLSEAMNTHYFQAVGCQHCGHSGYSGRLAAFEICEYQSGQPSVASEGGQAALNGGLLASALSHAIRGATSLTEVLRVFGTESITHLPSEHSNAE